MVAFVGLIDFDGGLPDESRLRHAAEAYPGEAYGDATVSIEPGCGLVTRPLRAAFDPPVFERSVDDGRFVVAGDTRIDDRSELLRSLDDPRLSERSGDAELVVSAIVKWGSRFAAHLTGEFAIAVWDRQERQLVLARDQLGARPLYYSAFGSKVAFASSTRALRRVVSLEPELNPETVADYIVLGELTDRGATFFRGLHSLPPAHAATCSEGRLDVRRYWDLPENSEVLVYGREEMREELTRLLRIAIRDRLRTNRVSLQLSGGLDSSMLAVMTQDELAGRGGLLSGLTMSHEELFEDDEPRLARLVGDRLGIPVSKFDVHDVRLWQGTAVPGSMTMERPGWGPFVAAWRKVYDGHAEAGPVAFSGDGGDCVLTTERQPFRWWWRRRDYQAIARAAAAAVRSGIALRAGLRSKGPSVMPSTEIPDWLDPDLIRSSGIEERIGDYVIDDRVWTGLPRPTLRAVLMRLRIEQDLELSHPAVTHRPVVYSLPFLDRRLIEHAFSWAPFPWLDQKFVVRDAMTGRLPDEVIRRPKQGLGGDPIASMVDAGLSEEIPIAVRELSGLGRENEFPKVPPTSAADKLPTWCRAIETALWRRSLT